MHQGILGFTVSLFSSKPSVRKLRQTIKQSNFEQITSKQQALIGIDRVFDQIDLMIKFWLAVMRE